jgi:hypothetical protein
VRAFLTASCFFAALTGLTPSLDAKERAVMSGDGTWRLSVSGSPQVLLIFHKNTPEPLRRYKVESTSGQTGQVTCLIEAPSRQSFLAVLGTVGEIWEMSYDPDAAPVFPGFVHNYRHGQVEGIEAEPQPFARRRLRLSLDHSALVFTPNHTEVIGRDSDAAIRVFNLDTRRSPGRLALQSESLLARSRFLGRDGETLLAIPSQAEERWHLFSTTDWKPAGELEDLPPTPSSAGLVCNS